ncbi:hypothetical protein PS858_02977 [Pseudomonas fluorescens]|uniref:Lipoprotein n=1 Tax=Pseudomonas fluorescens TaxID=294 RepID=A0A5E7DXX4_PSEFL|nr:hypothetical protein PS704_03573 [Pseudomonas fluorescens]VVP04480.1 hypothetical protein PS858_02977 [Pseudomonas fluorescens]
MQVHRTNVGASLLAMAVCQATMLLTATPSSPAGWLPQVICVARKNAYFFTSAEHAAL